MTKAISTELTTENIDAVLELLSGMPARLGALAGQLTPEQQTTPVGPGERTPTEILAHLLHCEVVTAEVVLLALLRKEPLLPGLHPERDIGRLLDMGQYGFGELRAYFAFRRRVLLNVLNGLGEKQWSRTVREEGKQRIESVYWLVRGQALHEDDHLQEIESFARG